MSQKVLLNGIDGAQLEAQDYAAKFQVAYYSLGNSRARAEEIARSPGHSLASLQQLAREFQAELRRNPPRGKAPGK